MIRKSATKPGKTYNKLSDSDLKWNALYWYARHWVDEFGQIHVQVDTNIPKEVE